MTFSKYLFLIFETCLTANVEGEIISIFYWKFGFIRIFKLHQGQTGFHDGFIPHLPWWNSKLRTVQNLSKISSLSWDLNVEFSIWFWFESKGHAFNFLENLLNYCICMGPKGDQIQKEIALEKQK